MPFIKSHRICVASHNFILYIFLLKSYLTFNGTQKDMVRCFTSNIFQRRVLYVTKLLIILSCKTGCFKVWRDNTNQSLDIAFHFYFRYIIFISQYLFKTFQFYLSTQKLLTSETIQPHHLYPVIALMKSITHSIRLLEYSQINH